MTTTTFPVLGEAYDRPTIQSHVKGHRGFIPHRNGKAVACCFKANLDPCAPDVLLLNEYYDDGKLLDNCREFIPFFRYIKERKHPSFGRWEYIGEYRVYRSTDKPGEISEELNRLGHPTRPCRLVLWLESRMAVTEREALRAEHGHAYQPDVIKRAAVENAAVRMTRDQFKDWHIEDVSDQNKGWDLEVTRGGELLYLEVKGLSGHRLVVELTPNEYTKMQKHSRMYRVCVATKAMLPDATLQVFRFRPGTRDLVADDGVRLSVKTVESARLVEE